MARSIPMHAAGGRDPELVRMLGLSATAHALVLAALLVLPLVKPAPLPIVAYTVELTDPNALGGRMAPGRPDLPMGPRGGAPSAGGPARQGEPAAAPAPAPPPPKEPEAPKPVERAKVEPPAPVEPAVKLPTPEKVPVPKPEAKKPPEPKPEPRPEAKKPEPEAAKPEARKPEAKAPETPKPEAKKAEPAKPDAAKGATKAAPAAAKAPDAKPAADAKPAGKPDGKPDGGDADGGDAYAAAATKWRTKGATGGGGGLGGTDTGEGPMGTPGYGAGGGQVVGFEFLAYQQRVVSTVKGVWTNAMARPGLVTKVRFRIAADGAVSGVRIEQSSGNAAFDGSTLRAVERANPLPPPPARYVNEFREFVIEFHSEDEGGRAAG